MPPPMVSFIEVITRIVQSETFGSALGIEATHFHPELMSNISKESLVETMIDNGMFWFR